LIIIPGKKLKLALTGEKNEISTFPKVIPFCGKKGKYTYIYT
jgi:hypothetical protein